MATADADADADAGPEVTSGRSLAWQPSGVALGKSGSGQGSCAIAPGANTNAATMHNVVSNNNLLKVPPSIAFPRRRVPAPSPSPSRCIVGNDVVAPQQSNASWRVDKYKAYSTGSGIYVSRRIRRRICYVRRTWDDSLANRLRHQSPEEVPALSFAPKDIGAPFVIGRAGRDSETSSFGIARCCPHQPRLMPSEPLKEDG